MKIIILKYNPNQLANNVVEFLVPKVIYLWKSYTYRFLNLIKNIIILIFIISILVIICSPLFWYNSKYAT